MTQRQRTRRPDPRPDGASAGISTLTLEEEAVRAGVQAGDAALLGLDLSGVLVLFAGRRRSEETAPDLELLRNYAELRRALMSLGRNIPATSLVAAGYTATEIARFDAMIASVPSGAAPNIPGPRSTIGDRLMNRHAGQSDPGDPAPASRQA